MLDEGMLYFDARLSRAHPTVVNDRLVDPSTWRPAAAADDVGRLVEPWPRPDANPTRGE